MKSQTRQPVDKVTFLDPQAQAFIAVVGQSLTSQSDPSDQILGAVLPQVAKFLDAEAASIFVVDESTGDLVLQHASGEVGEKLVGLRLPAGQGVVGWVVKYSEDLIVPYPGLDARFFEGVDESTGFSTHSILCGPIVHGERVIGAIEILNKREGTFNDDDLILLRAIARQMAEVLSR